jgi:hypothetical protein
MDSIKKSINKMSYEIKWGSHIKRFKNLAEAKLFAYYKAFYFDVYFDGVLFKRAF